jgi:Zn-dependent peptidase ImmA (M78 family)
VCGATRWLTPEKALIQLSLRYRSDDHLWFTFFHEAAHILLHGKRAVFVESQGASAKASLVDKVKRRAEEDEANRFAGDILIPLTQYSALLKAQTFSAAAIKAFADQIGIAPGIVLGRLQHDHVVPFKTPLNSLKRYFDWAHP